MSNPVSADDIQAITHINYVTNNLHSLTDNIYEDLMDRDHEAAKKKAKNIIQTMSELIKSLSDEI
ncbi:MAG: hypothetical protein CMJ25_02985 [Phycisphaerae bacterium]|jgi:uncharacterized membrane protein YoaK (UPF0700 family)|nr:hypothetical protein [Phycisphaerae bacterium]|tara:strand:- start:118 stop:312 length:195 start_codon:yes stop_codon:yes gene_type:complete